jgi:hypothetical protein
MEEECEETSGADIAVVNGLFVIVIGDSVGKRF